MPPVSFCLGGWEMEGCSKDRRPIDEKIEKRTKNEAIRNKVRDAHEKEISASETATNARTLPDLSISLAWLMKENRDYRAQRCLAFEVVWRRKLYKIRKKRQNEPSEQEKLERSIGATPADLQRNIPEC